jgi:hypothetical protein
MTERVTNMDKPIEVTVPGVRAKFEDWIKTRGGILVWENVNLSNPGAGPMFTPVRDAEGKTNCKNSPPHWTHRYHETCTDIKDFKFVKEMCEVNRFRVAVRMGSQGLMVKLTDASTKKLHKALDKAKEKTGQDASYRFDYDTQEAVIEVPLWE